VNADRFGGGAPLQAAIHRLQSPATADFEAGWTIGLDGIAHTRLRPSCGKQCQQAEHAIHGARDRDRAIGVAVAASPPSAMCRWGSPRSSTARSLMSATDIIKMQSAAAIDHDRNLGREVGGERLDRKGRAQIPRECTGVEYLIHIEAGQRIGQNGSPLADLDIKRSDGNRKSRRR